MSNTVRPVLVLGVVLGFSVLLRAQSIVPLTGHTLSRHELNKYIVAAHTPEQNSALALYFHQQQRSFSAKAADEKSEWERRRQVSVSVGVKYPAPADSAHNLYDYYAYEANQMLHRATQYELKSKQVQVSQPGKL